MSNLSVRWGSAGDYERAAELSGRPIPLRRLDAREVVVAEIEDRLIGVLRFVRLWDHVPLIEFVRVEPSERRRGVATALLAFLTAELRRNGHRFVLSSAQSDESDPQEWHRRVGFVECGRVRDIDGPGTSEVFVRLDL